MKQCRFLTGLIAVCVLLTSTPAPASFHLWTIAELYSNSDGSVQFIELVSSGSAETQANGAQILTDSGSVYTISGNLAGNTFNDRLLFATPGFYSLPGAPAISATQPVYNLTANFFNPTSDRVRLFSPLFGEFHSRTINASSPVPTDNVFSRVYSGATSSIAANSPQARDVAAGSIDRGDYNGNGVVDAADYVVWRKTLTQTASPAGAGADGNTNGVIDNADFALWRARFGNVFAGAGSGSSAVPEPSSVALLFAALVGLLPERRRR